MPSQDSKQAPLETAPQATTPSVVAILIRNTPLACWAITLVLSVGMVFEVFGSLRRTSGSTNPQIVSLNWAWTAIAVRAAVALVRRQRTWWSLAYVALFFALPFIAEITVKWWRASL